MTAAASFSSLLNGGVAISSFSKSKYFSKSESDYEVQRREKMKQVRKLSGKIHKGRAIIMPVADLLVSRYSSKVSSDSITFPAREEACKR